jgi:hypothetical protein
MRTIERGGEPGRLSNVAHHSWPLPACARPLLASGGHLSRATNIPYDSWRLVVEAYNKRDWRTVPTKCERYVGNYMLGGHYRRDSHVVIDEAIAYAESLKLTGNARRRGCLTSMRRRSQTSPTTLPTASGTNTQLQYSKVTLFLRI